MGLDASLEAVEGLGLETGVYWRYPLTGEERAKTIRSRNGRDEKGFTNNVLEMLGLVMRAFVMIVIRREMPARVGKPC